MKLHPAPSAPKAHIALAVLVLLLSACASKLELPPPLQSAERLVQQGGNASASGAEAQRFETMPAAPDRVASAPTRPAPAQPSKPAPRAGTAAINFEQVPLGSVIQVVYADVLGRTVQIDPQVMSRRDLVTFRTPPEESTAQIEAAMDLLLRSYGLTVIDVGGLVRVLPDGSKAGGLPEIRLGHALPETPAAMRPIFQLVPLSALRVNEVATLLKTLVGSRVTVQEEPVRNAVVLSGNGASVATAMEALRAIDQPVMSGRAALRVTPTYWSVAELATTLHQVLTAEGYTLAPPNQPPSAGGMRYPITLLPVASLNSLLVFTQDQTVADHVQRWVTQLDQPGRQTTGRNLFTYTAKNLSAEALARTLAQLFEGSSSAAATQAARPATGAAAQGQQPAGFGAVTGASSQTSFAGGRIVVDANSNTLVINTTPENYAQLVGLLNQFDRPPKSALIEVTVAEVELTDQFKLGVDWLFEQAGLGRTANTGGLIPGSYSATQIAGNLVMRRLAGNGDLRVTLNALATSNQANILSSPRIVARNGEVATIQVGSEVPIVTSQATGVVGAGSNGLLTSVQYRSTGVQLKVKPSIYAGDRIDLEIAQEVSSAGSTNTGVNITPTFSTKKVETRLTLEHGNTVMLGGLISSDRTDTDAGVPLLKDIPLVGHLFKTRDDRKTRRELLVLITPYIINDSQDAAQLTESFKALLPQLAPAPTKPK